MSCNGLKKKTIVSFKQIILKAREFFFFDILYVKCKLQTCDKIQIKINLQLGHFTSITGLAY